MNNNKHECQHVDNGVCDHCKYPMVPVKKDPHEAFQALKFMFDSNASTPYTIHGSR